MTSPGALGGSDAGSPVWILEVGSQQHSQRLCRKAHEIRGAVEPLVSGTNLSGSGQGRPD